MKRPYRLSESQQKNVKIQLEAALDKGWIKPSMSAWGTAVLMMPKKDGSWRMCVDYHELNALTMSNACPLPRIYDFLHQLGKARVYSKVNLQFGYHQIWIKPEDREKTAFRVSDLVRGHCLFEWTVMPFSLKNASPTF